MGIHFNILNVIYLEGELDQDLLLIFIKDMKNETNLSNEEIAQLAAAKVADSKPKSRM